MREREFVFCIFPYFPVQVFHQISRINDFMISTGKSKNATGNTNQIDPQPPIQNDPLFTLPKK
jgi:hypothetical protein